MWVQYAVTPGEKKRYEKTGIRKDDPHQKQKRARYRAELEERILGNQLFDKSAGWEWVPGWLNIRFKGNNAQTLYLYRRYWKYLSRFLHEREIASPAHLTRDHCYDYVTWRTTAVRSSGKQTGTNTAIFELKILAYVLDEAAKRHLCSKENPARKLGIRREDARQKPPFTDDDLQKVFAALESKPEWMRRSFFLALHTGLRFSDTRLNRAQVNWPAGTLEIEKPKGGRKREFAIPIYASIEPMLRTWWEEEAPHLWDLPERIRGSMKRGDYVNVVRKMAPMAWHWFFAELGLPHTFHSTRVTFISRGALSGINESLMMKLCNHAKSDVHRVYQRLPMMDAKRLVEAVPIPLAFDATKRSPSKR